MCVGGSLCVLGMAVPFRKVSEYFGVLGYISCWCLGLCDSWSLLVQEVGRGKVVDASQEEPAVPAHRADCPKGCVLQSHPAEQVTAASPLGVSQGLHTDLHRSADTEVTGPPVRQLLELVVTGWLLKIFFKPMERSGQPC